MRRLVVILIVLSTGSMAYAQVGGSVLPVPVPGVPIPFYGWNSSALDHNGNLLVFDTMYSYQMPMATQRVVQTRLTIIASDGTVKQPVQYPGAFQVVGTGWFAVYAIVNTYVAGQTPTRRLVAFNVVAGVPLSPCQPLMSQFELT
jgi:hypothetical protein